MKKQLFFLAAAALALASCSSENDVVQTPDAQQTTADEVAVSFDSYVSRNTTRAGWAGTLNTDALKDAAKANGFGVFGYYTNGELYNETARPDFMYNQQVTYDGSQWTYSPIKYWPNEFGTNASSEEIDRLTFFAYAPYAASNPTTGVVNGDATNGIVGMTRNTTSGNPLIKYYANLTPADGVDLCWGVAKSEFNSSVDGAVNKVKPGEPYIDVIKPKIDDKIYFDFKHALAQLNVQIDADVDVVSHNTSTLDQYTRIYVRSITFEGFTTKGALDLNSDISSGMTPNWFDISGNSKLSLDPITVFDGRRDGKEGVPTVNGKNETPADLNPVIIQSGAYIWDDSTPITTVYPSFNAPTAGVTNTAVNLFNSTTLDAPVLVIPTGEGMKVTIVYDVETADPSLSGYLSDGATRGSTIENAITQDIKVSSTDMVLESGKKYTVKLHLGLTSVKFDAEVTDWVNADYSDVDLPYNTPGVGAGSSNSFSIDASTTTGSFVVSGLTTGNFLHTSGTSPVSNTQINGTYYTGTGIAVPSSGEATISYSVPENTSVSNRSFTVYANERKSDNTLVTSTVANVTQLCKPFVPTYSWASGDNQFVITAAASSGVVTTSEWAAADIVVESKASPATSFSKLEKDGSDTGYTVIYDTNRVVVRLGASVGKASGDQIQITIKVGDGEAKQFTHTF